MPDFATLIPELGEWNAGKGISIESWISCVGNVPHAIGYSRLFWPEFLVHNDCVLFAARFDAANFSQWWQHTNGERAAIERVLNHTHLYDLFPNVSAEPSPAQIAFLADVLREMWHAKLARDFPDRICSVEYFAEPADDPQITIVQQKHLRRATAGENAT